MIKQEEFQQLDNIDVVEKIYDELLLNGVNAIPSPDKKVQQKYFSKLCHDLIQKYLIWNDYIHANNIMQLFKSIALKGTTATKPSWLIRYEIIIYGKRTPLYFVDNSKILFDKINTICKLDKSTQTEKLESAVESLFNFYKHNFMNANCGLDDQMIFFSHFKDNFIPEYKKTDKSLFPSKVLSIIDTFIDYFDNPTKYVEPGITKEQFEIYNEEDEEIIIDVPKKDKNGNNDNSGAQGTELSEPTNIVEESAKPKLKNLKGKTIRFIGGLNKSSIKNKFIGISKEYEFELELYDDYNKITNMDFSKMRYSNRIDGIIAGPMPHSIKGMGSYSSGLEMIKSEPGYPPVVECISSDKLKITATSLWKALVELDSEFGSK